MTRTTHLKKQAHRASPFEISERAIVALAFRVGEAMRTQNMKPNALVVVAESREIKRVGKSNGQYLCVIVREYLPRTILLRRRGQRQLTGLPQYRYSRRWDNVYE